MESVTETVKKCRGEFRRHNTPSIAKLPNKFEENGTVQDTRQPAKTLLLLRGSVAHNPKTSIRHPVQQLYIKNNFA